MERNMFSRCKSSLLASLAALCLQCAANDVKPPIPITFTLEKDQYVTLVVEDKNGKRVRNLVKDEFFKKGTNTVWWDGLTDHGQTNIRVHGGYDVTGTLVEDGEYVVRGIAHDQINLVWQFCPYLPNNPIRTSNRQGQWLSDHTPPCSLAWVTNGEGKNEIIAGATLAEGAHSIMWLTPEGKKIEGLTHIGSTYTGPAKICPLRGKDTNKDFTSYGLGISKEGMIFVGFSKDRRARRLYYNADDVFKTKHYFAVMDRRKTWFSAAVYNKMAVIGSPSAEKLIVLDLSEKEAKEVKKIPFKNSRGMAFDEEGNLYIVKENKLLKFKNASTLSIKESDGEVLTDELDSPTDVIVERGRIFVSQQGKTHNVVELDAKGSIVCIYGKEGAPKCGPYDEEKMHYPQGLMLTPNDELWVAEEDHQPKRISVWDAKKKWSLFGKARGEFKKAFYGPVQYGGGGKIDPYDPSRFYYYGIEMKIDIEKGTEKVVNIYARSDAEGVEKGYLPQDPVIVNNTRYMCNTYDQDPISGPLVEAVFRYDDDGKARLVAKLGQLTTTTMPDFFNSSLTNLLSKERYVGAHYYSSYNDKPWGGIDTVFAWSDVNENGVMEESEIELRTGRSLGINRIEDSLDMVFGDGSLVKVKSFTKTGVPIYDLKNAENNYYGLAIPQCQVIVSRQGKGFARLGTWTEEVAKKYGINARKWEGGAVSGIDNKGRYWYYPYRWRGLHASGLFPGRKPYPGELIGGTKLIGPAMTLGKDNLEVFALNANSGQIYLMSVDGFFVTALFKHGWHSVPWANNILTRGYNVNEWTSDGEGFQQTITRIPDGRVYIQALNHTSSIIEVQGLSSIHRLKDFKITVTKEQLERAKYFESEMEAARQRAKGTKKYLLIGGKTITLDGKSDDWDDCEFVLLDDKREAALKLGYNKDGKPCLFAALRSGSHDVLKNSGVEPWINMFKTGGAFDIQIATGDDLEKTAKRLLMSEVDGKLRAILYEPKSNKKGSPGKVSSPHRTVHFDYVGDVSQKISMAKDKMGWKFRLTNAMSIDELKGFRWYHNSAMFFEFEIPLDLLEWKPKAGKTYKGDVGFLLGDGSTVKRRTYWNNKGTSHLYDAPEESMLYPKLWGDFIVHKVARPQENNRNINVLRTRSAGVWKIDSKKVEKSAPCVGIDWTGTGSLPQRNIGSKGYVVFRYDPVNWFDSKMHKKVMTPFTMEPLKHENCRSEDGLIHSVKCVRMAELSIDNIEKKNKGTYGSGGNLGCNWYMLNMARWQINIADKKPHRITCVMPHGGDKTRIFIEQNGKKEVLEEFTGEDFDYSIVVQFDITGDFVLGVEHDKYEKNHDANTDKRKGAGSMQAIFFD